VFQITRSQVHVLLVQLSMLSLVKNEAFIFVESCFASLKNKQNGRTRQKTRSFGKRSKVSSITYKFVCFNVEDIELIYFNIIFSGSLSVRLKELMVKNI
jgi:hypothetical protein